MNFLISAVFALSSVVRFSNGDPNINFDAAIPADLLDIVGFFELEIAILTLLSQTRKAGWITGLVLCPITAVEFAIRADWLQGSISAVLMVLLLLRQQNLQRSGLT
jgi:hypothetical protein